MHVSLSLPVSISLSNTPSPTHSLSLSLSGVVSTMTPVEHRLRQILVPEMLATDIAEYLVRKGLPFRETHHIAGNYMVILYLFFILVFIFIIIFQVISPTIHFYQNLISSLSHSKHLCLLYPYRCCCKVS